MSLPSRLTDMTMITIHEAGAGVAVAAAVARGSIIATIITRNGRRPPRKTAVSPLSWGLVEARSLGT